MQKKGTDITWKIAVVDGTTPVVPSSLADYQMKLFTFVNGNQRKYWLEFVKTPTSGQRSIYIDGNQLVIVVPRSFTTTAADGDLNIEVRITETDTSGRYDSNLKVSDVQSSNSGSDYFTICTLVS
jgi:hypothetical protein